MSQWYDSPFEVDGIRYASTEMWMMIQKAKLFGDEVLGPTSLLFHSTLTYYLQGHREDDDADDCTLRASEAWKAGERF